MIERDIELLRATGGKLHLAHVSCEESVELLAEAQADGLTITAEATPYHLALTSEEREESTSLPPRHGLAKVNPPLRPSSDVKAIQTALAQGVIAAVGTDHAPHPSTTKCGGLEGSAFGFTGFGWHCRSYWTSSGRVYCPCLQQSIGLPWVRHRSTGSGRDTRGRNQRQRVYFRPRGCVASRSRRHHSQQGFEHASGG